VGLHQGELSGTFEELNRLLTSLALANLFIMRGRLARMDG
jgi:hypothetical protein